jgi:hypothetical protein
MKLQCVATSTSFYGNIYNHEDDLEIGKIYESSDTAMYKDSNMYFIPSVHRLIPKELFIELSLIREHKLSKILDEKLTELKID